MPEYIEREALIKAIRIMPRTIHPELVRYSTVQAIIDKQPAADVVEVVRCKNCKHFCPYEGEEHKGDCAELVGLESCVYEDDFCSYGERKDSNENGL